MSSYEVQLLVCLSTRSTGKEQNEAKEMIIRTAATESNSLAILSQYSRMAVTVNKKIFIYFLIPIET